MNHTPRVFAVVNQKGGVGKTTTAVNLAHGLAKRCYDQRADGRPDQVLLVDFDAQGNCAHSLGIYPNGKNLAHVLSGASSVRDNLLLADRQADGLPRPNLWLIPSDQELAQAKSRLIMQEAVQNTLAMIDPTQRNGERIPLVQVMRERLGAITPLFRYVIIDCPPAHDVLMNAVYDLADAAIVPVKVDYLSTIGARQNIENIRQAQLAGIAIRIHTVVPTFYVKRQIQDNQILEALQQAYGVQTVAEPIPRNQTVAEAAASGGMTLLEYAPDSPAAQAYTALVERVYHER